MKLTPMDVRKADFRRALRGYDPEEVRILLDMVAEEYEKLLQENGMLSEKIRHLSERLDEYHSLEKTLQSSILTAERIAAESQERSRREAESLIEDGRVRGERILEDARERLRMLSREIEELRTQKDLFVRRFQSLLAAQADLLAAGQSDLEKADALDARASSLITGEGVARAESRALAQEPPTETESWQRPPTGEAAREPDAEPETEELLAAPGASDPIEHEEVAAASSVTPEPRPHRPISIFARREKQPAPTESTYRRPLRRSSLFDSDSEEGAEK